MGLIYVSRKPYEGSEFGVIEGKGITFSSNVTCRYMIIFFWWRSKYRKPQWLSRYPRKTQRVNLGTSLCGGWICG